MAPPVQNTELGFPQSRSGVDARFMGLAAILPGSSARILVYGHLASRGGTRNNRRGDVECSRHRVTTFRCMSVSISLIAVGVSVSVLGTVCLRSVGASPRTVSMGILSVVILRSDFTMLEETHQ